jgi:hypothetical protein
VYLAPPPLPPLYRQVVVFLSQSSWVAADGIGGAGGMGEEPNHTITRKPVTL